MLRFTGNPKYGDNMERVLLNGMLATLPMQPDGKTFYYSDYRSGTQKKYFRDLWPCCSGTFAQITADYPLDIYFHNENGIYVNLFASSTVQWTHGKHAVTLEQSTDFPESDTTTLTIRVSKPDRFALNVRVPAWTSGAVKVKVNNKIEKVKSSPGSFLKIERSWSDGDKVQVTLPMAPHYEAIAPESPNVRALLYGPMLLVALTDKPVTLTDNDARIDVVKGPNGLPTFHSHDGKLTFLPFHKVKDERYTTYLTFGAGK